MVESVVIYIYEVVVICLWMARLNSINRSQSNTFDKWAPAGETFCLLAQPVCLVAVGAEMEAS
jgi:hypothetical protein